MSHLNSNQLPSPAPSPYPADGGPTDPDAVRAELEAQLLRLSQDLYEMEVCAGEVGAGMEDAVPNYLAKINTAFINLSNLAPQITDSVPRNVIDNVDRHKNPHQYTKTMLSRATGENQYALGRQLGLESFRRQLHDALSESFPGVPMPERRHKPAGTEGTEEGEGETGAAAAVAADADAKTVDGGNVGESTSVNAAARGGAGAEPEVTEVRTAEAGATPGAVPGEVEAEVPSAPEPSSQPPSDPAPEPSTAQEVTTSDDTTAAEPAAGEEASGDVAESQILVGEADTEGAASTANGTQVNGAAKTEHL